MLKYGMKIGFFCFRQYLPHRIPSMRNLQKSVWKTVLQLICFSSLTPTLMWQPLGQWQLSLEDKYTDIPISRYYGTLWIFLSQIWCPFLLLIINLLVSTPFLKSLDFKMLMLIKYIFIHVSNFECNPSPVF